LWVTEFEHAAETLSAFDRTLVVYGRSDEKAIVEALMTSFSLVALDKLAQSPAQVRFAERNDSGQALLPDRTHPPFRVGVEIRASGWKLHWQNDSVAAPRASP
jgi:hypothetical protein